MIINWSQLCNEVEKTPVLHVNIHLKAVQNVYDAQPARKRRPCSVDDELQ
jgi:hypothetical protein